jgi:hypothetical protein
MNAVRTIREFDEFVGGLGHDVGWGRKLKVQRGLKKSYNRQGTKDAKPNGLSQEKSN